MNALASAGDQTRTSAEDPGRSTEKLVTLSPTEVRRGLRISTIEGAFATINISITGAVGGSVFLTGFALLLGANSFQLGLLGALPFIGQLCGFLAAYLEERIGRRRPLVLFGALGGRLLWALLLTLPFLTFLDGWQMTIFMIGLALSYGLNGIAGNAWLSWMSDLVPPRQRGSYFGIRNTVAGVLTMAATYAAGYTLDSFRDSGEEAIGYAIIFTVALVAALGSAALIARQPEPPMDKKARVRPAAMFSAPMRNSRFRSFAMLSTGWALVTGVAAPFFNAYGLNALQLSFATLALTAIVTSAVSLVFQPLIGRLQDRFGDRQVLLWCMLGTLPLPWGWVLSTPDNIIPLWLTAIFSGVFWPGITQGQVNILMDRASSESRGASIAAYSALTGLGTLVAGVLGGVIATFIAGTQLTLGPLQLNDFALLFVLTSLGRAVVALLHWRSL
ncbi:MFS transporter [Candidatus Gracilibacteria bacterium]|nr:MFS transporter [Candidatus Gracilibacteria bacterium]